MQTKHRFVTTFEKLTLGLLCVIAFISLVFFVSRIWRPLVVSTNLQELAPKLSEDAQLQSAVEKLSASMEQRFILLLEANDEDLALDAGEFLEDSLSQIGFIASLSDLESSQLLELYGRHPFNFLSSEDKTRIQESTPEALLQEAKRSIYSSASAARLYPISQDPFNLLGNYIYQLLETQSGDKYTEDGLIYSPQAEQDRYYLPLFYSISQGGLSLDNQEQLVNTISKIEQTIGEEYPGVKLYRSGVVFYSADAARKSKKDISAISIGSTIGVTLLLIFAFKSIAALILPMGSIAFGIAFAFAGTHLAFGSIHILTVVFGASLIGVVIDYALHYFYHAAETKTEAQRRTLYRALGLSLFTSILGYGALAFSDLISLQQIAIFSCFGLVAAWLAIVSLSPRLLPNTLSPKLGIFLICLNKMHAVIRPLVLSRLWVSLALAGLFFFILLYGVKTSDDPRSFFNPDPELFEQDKLISAVVSDYEPGKYIAVKGKSDQEIFSRLTLLAEKKQGKPLLTIARWLPSPKTQRENYASQALLYNEKGLAAELLKQLNTPEQKINSLKNTYSAQSQATLNIEEFVKHSQNFAPPLWAKSGDEQIAFALIPKGEDLETLKNTINTLDGIDYIDTLADTKLALSKQRQEAGTLLISAYSLIAFMLCIYYGGLSCLKMLLVPISATFTVLVIFQLTGVSVTLFHTMALFLVLGLGMDYVIFTTELSHNSQVTRVAVFVSTLTSLLSFGLLSFSSLSIVNAIGLTILLGNLCNFIATLIFAEAKKATLMRAQKYY